MTSAYQQIKVPAILLLVIMLCLPVYRLEYFPELSSTVESNHTQFVCVYTEADSSQESHESPQHIAQCHELDQPGLMASTLNIDYSPAISTLTSSDKNALLPGYDVPLEIPPKSRV